MKDWNSRYAKAGTAPDTRLFGDQPSEYLREVMARSDFRPRSALCLADGDGRNGGWLAQQGLEVTAVDASTVATEHALAHDAARGRTVERIAADLADWTPPPGRAWDAVFLMYLQCEAAVRLRAARVAAAALAPGGWFVAEGFAPAGAGGRSLGPEDPDLLYEMNDFLDVLCGLEVVEALKGRIRVNDGVRHRGEARVVRLLLRRPETEA
ncbi:MAG: class I SAM-dependent methyltransferase [Rhodospirillales bacterium CG15_BIG_FIL_POST_REV_8_21_14_020_66_15]|nr:MAG: class I SAM-dependent methyltransferase [Rhodospirillales bacterium CG15_BIG_FIL_POST_REV_8_21_14_020_66_15]